MHDISTQVLAVDQQVSQNGSIRHEVSLAGGQAADGTQYPPQKYVTFDAQLAGKAQGLVGQPAVDARVQIKQVPKRQGGGFWTNFVLEDIAPQGTLIPMGMPVAGGTPAQAAPIVQPVQPAQGHPHPLVAADDARQDSIERQSAYKAALEFVGRLAQAGMVPSLAEAELIAARKAEELVRFAKTGSFADTAPLTAVADSPGGVVNAVNAEAGAPVVQQGAEGLPWQPEPQQAA